MQQTILALAAILAFSTYALTRHRADQEVELHAMGAEAELAAADIARTRMAQLERYAFDEDDVDRTGVRQSAPTSGIGPDLGEVAPIAFDDVDDWDDYTETVPYALGVDSLHFTIAVHVQYVVPNAPSTSSATPTLAKEVVVRVDELGVNARSGRRAAEATLRRLVTPASIAASTRLSR